MMNGLRVVVFLAIAASATTVAAQAPRAESALSRILDGAPEAAPDAAPPLSDPASTTPTGTQPAPAETPPFIGPALPPPRVCLALPLTGVHAPLGNRIATRMTAVLAQAPDVEVIRLDTQGATSGAEAAVTRAWAAGCGLLTGGIGDREAVALADAAARHGMPAVVLGGAPDARVRDRVVWARASRALRAQALARHLVDTGIVTAWVLAVDSPHGNAERRAFEQAFAAVGGQVGAVVPLPADLSELADATAAAAERIRAARTDGVCVAEAFVLVHDVPGARRLLGFLEFQGLLAPQGPRCPAPTLAGSPNWLEGPALGRTRSLDGALVAGIRVRGATDDLLEAEAMDAADLIVAALKAGSGATRATVLGALRALDPQPARTGTLRIEGDRVVGQDIQVFAVRRGTPEPAVEAPEAAWTNSD
jgi:ABC-type branched-subunit amino acid transport system substrate-binding protein